MNFSLIPLIGLSLGLSQGTPAPQAVSPTVLYRPSAMPDSVRLTWSGDPATTQSVTWRTDSSVTAPIAQVTSVAHGPNLEGPVQEYRAKSSAIESELGWTTLYHTATFAGLQPATEYMYRVGDGVNWSEWFHFRTTASKFEPFSFIYLGDAQNGIRTHWSRVFRRAFSEDTKAKFVIYSGDLINNANNEAQWRELYDGPGWVNASTPIVPVTGNHEHFTDPKDGYRVSYYWRPQFELPLNGPVGLEETCYSIDVQGVRIIALNSSQKQAEQVAWLEGKLKNNPNRWTIVCFHHPIYSSAVRRDNPELRAMWKPLFDKYRVDMVLQGHDHTYARNDFNSVKSTIADGKETAGGTVYVVTVSGSKMYELSPQPWMVRKAEDTQFYQNLKVEKDRIIYEARTAAGELYDKFVIVKRKGQTNRLIDMKPKTSERLRPKAKVSPQ